MDDKLKWMLEQAKQDDMSLTYGDVAMILASDEQHDPYTAAETDYIWELAREWEAEQ